MTEHASLIIKRLDHYELHFPNYVEFRSLSGKFLGKSKVEPYEC